MHAEFTAARVKGIIPDIMMAVLRQSHVLQQPLMQIAPNGYDVNAFGRTTSKKARSSYYQIINSEDCTQSIKRTLKSGNRKVSISLHREYKFYYKNSRHYYKFEDEYSMHIEVVDYELASPHINEDFYTFKFFSGSLGYDGNKSFHEFLVQDLVEEYNSRGLDITAEWSERVATMRTLMCGVRKYK